MSSSKHMTRMRRRTRKIRNKSSNCRRRLTKRNKRRAGRATKGRRGGQCVACKTDPAWPDRRGDGQSQLYHCGRRGVSIWQDFWSSRNPPGPSPWPIFAPIFLYRGGDRVLFEAGFDFILQNNAPASAGATTTVNLSFAQLNYLLNDYVTLAVGNMLLPLGTYAQRSAGWLNKFPG